MVPGSSWAQRTGSAQAWPPGRIAHFQGPHMLYPLPSFGTRTHSLQTPHLPPGAGEGGNWDTRSFSLTHEGRPQGPGWGGVQKVLEDHTSVGGWHCLVQQGSSEPTISPRFPGGTVLSVPWVMDVVILVLAVSIVS